MKLLLLVAGRRKKELLLLNRDGKEPLLLDGTA